MTFKNKVNTSIMTMAAAASFLLSNTPVFASEAAAAPNEAVIESAGFLGGLNFAEENEISTEQTKKAGFREIDGKIYYHDEFGMKQTGLIQHDGQQYYFDENGVLKTGFQKINGDTYYFAKADGHMLTGMIHLDQKTYFLQEDGKMLSGWKEEDGKTVYYKEDGFMYKDEIVRIDGNSYSFDENGFMETNVSKNGYDFGADGVGKTNASAYQRIADAALAQVGVYQDCTMLVTNSLKAVGINFHGWPHEYLSLGPLTNDPVPGDIVVYQGHVAIYIGDGKAVHGGWNGNQTVVWSVACNNALVGYVHPILP